MKSFAAVALGLSILASGSFLVDGVVSREDSRALGARVDVLPPFAGG